ncbi:zinc finger protein 25 isoform X2 [Aedes aegypti]|uniref:C2H2-type domain-containing protein n=1 Tax=Aedes aegypti TaxID=7159 RepID=A0A6I8U199_AEDAE|nr:zinc finger protein 25 isoform X2 [Aedes aegypti]
MDMGGDERQTFSDGNGQNSEKKWSLVDKGGKWQNSRAKLDQAIEEHLPQRICRTCQRKVDDVLHFQIETVSNMQLLMAVAKAKQYGSLTTLESQLQTDPCRNGLFRMNLIRSKDLSEAEIMQELRRNLLPESSIDIKTEPLDIVDYAIYQQTEDTVLDECVVNNDLQMKFELGEETDEPTSKIAKLSVKKRPCTTQGCESVTIGQGMQHAIEKHRSYCKICGQVFGKLSQAMYHVAVHKPKEERLSCTICSKTFCRKYGLDTHLLEFHGQATANHECSLCEQVFYKKTDLAKHREVHLKSPCQFCDRKKPFGSYKKLKEHFRMIHEKQIFKCEQCASSFLGRREHENHIEKHRDGTIDNCVEFALRLWNDNFKCTVCDRSFYNETYLDAHLEKEHKVYNIKAPDCKSNMIVPDYKFKCKECDATYRLKSSLKGHVFKNHRSQPKVCTHCGATFKSNNELDCHVRYLHTKDFRFKCDFCDKRCNTNSDLQVHRRTHTNERPYKCSYEGCGKDYKTNGAIIKHIRSVHTMERPYKCSYENCDRSFVCSQQLKSHGFTHTKEKPFPCAYCELRFNQNYLRRAHCRKRHPGQPDEVVPDGKDNLEGGIKVENSLE